MHGSAERLDLDGPERVAARPRAEHHDAEEAAPHHHGKCQLAGQRIPDIAQADEPNAAGRPPVVVDVDGRGGRGGRVQCRIPGRGLPRRPPHAMPELGELGVKLIVERTVAAIREATQRRPKSRGY
jgi:hypothetical protein